MILAAYKFMDIKIAYLAGMEFRPKLNSLGMSDITQQQGARDKQRYKGGRGRQGT